MTVTARFQMPDLIEQGLNNTLEVDAWFNGARVTSATTTGTVSVYDDAGTAKAGPVAFSIVADKPTHTFGAGTFSANDYGDGWSVEWTVTTGAGDVYVWRNEAALVRRKLYPVVTDQDLFRRASSLDPAGTNPITSVANFQSYISEAWVTIQLRLWSQGNRPNLIMSPAALRDCHLFLTLALIFRDLSTRLNEAFIEHAEKYDDMFESSFGQLKFRYDDGAEDGTSDEPGSRKGAVSTVWLSGRR
jgi:hypothetical protein